MSYVLTSLSGNLISAASAGWAPTNSAEVSAIASAYATGGAQVVTSLQYATSESATVATTVTADTAVGYGTRDISAEYYDYGYGSWIEYDSSKPLVQVRMTAVGNMTNYSSNPYYLYVVPYGATNDGNVSTTSQLTDALAFGEFSGGMNDLIVAEGTGSANSQDPYVVEVNFDVTHVPFWGSEPAYWGTVEGSYAVVDNNEYTRPVFCVAGGYDGSQLFELRNNITAELDFGSVVTVSSVSGINNLGIYTTSGGGGGVVTSIDDDTVYVYGINGMPISAVAAYNADYAGSATRDNSGRFLTSLPDSASVSAIASAYANSAASSKLSISSLEKLHPSWSVEPLNAYSGINGVPIFPTGTWYAESADYWTDASSKLDESATADFYSTSNPSGFIDSAYVDSAVSSKADSSALSSYALSADVSGTVDLVSTQSANWGGSALALSAGPGVKLEKVGNTLVAGLDRTLLWSGTRNLSATGTWALSGNPFDYEQVQIWARPHNTHKSELGCTVMPNLDSNSVTDVCIMGVQDALTHVRFNIANLRIDSSGFYVNSSKQISVPDTTANTPTILTRVYGINRTAGV